MSGAFPRSALVLTPKAFGADGISALTHLVASSLRNAGADTRVLALDVEPRRDLCGPLLNVPVESADGGKLRFVLNGLKSAPRARRPEIVVVTHLRMLPAALPLMAGGVPIATFLLGVECWRPLSHRDRRLLAQSERLLPISNWTWTQFLVANPSFIRTPMTVCHPGIETLPLPTSPAVPGRVVVVGRLWSEERYKGHDLLIDVWPAVRRRCPHAELVIVGDGDDRTRLEQRVRDAGLVDAIRFAGLVTQEELRRQLAAAQVFVLPSQGEGFGIVFLEAMRAARPCIAAEGAAEEVVVDGVTGTIIPAGNREALTDALVTLLGDPRRCEEFGRAGRQRIEDEYSDARFAERLLVALEGSVAAC